ncbi:ornithine carbamoyltransferase [Agrobacterium vitis]|uniref:ornithine carbamoyltransferase n=1 Tax=Rhizobium/Agrobacterium group TaxID=227290 RepID=UPI0008DC21E4|nr:MULTISPECIES: ornithine carbamoyltransferase [Rhizobium/Agrobacterium group]MCF1433472.1 ornithine carbamoyltransferase [Allorhizobium ampelinum]MUO90705.1 ornithine carbamoyltransferase [Agrobacterium vitis]MUZ54067.1 ornithine carbamoyltransferase [Agrobacterium vitis]MUZ92741.1 ornithine carbamoyltransferase [Agrobacterium vitis]MVA40500.1 ornithine carbamoyltransferase [Agrobacterium vitis]
MNFQSTRDFLEFHSLPVDILAGLIERAEQLATHWDSRTMPQTLKGKNVGIIVDDTGWRNTAAFDLGVKAMGGIGVQLPISFNVRETTTDLAGYLDNWFDLLVVRTKELATLKELASTMRAPVINARTKSNHPCETLGDLAYVRKVKGSLEGLKVVGIAPDANILRSWVETSKSMSIDVVQVYPDRWHVTDPLLINANFEASRDIRHVFDADVIITDSWPTDAGDGELIDYQVTGSILNECKSNAIFLPCPPVARNQEVTAEAMEHNACQSRQAKAFLLHAQNALMEWAIGT